MNKTKETIEYYNKNSESYISSTLDLNLESLYKPFLEHLKPGAKILDAGCGPGRDVKYFHGLGFEVVGIDASEEMVKKAREVTGLEILQLDFSQVQFENEFDAVWACASLLHIPKSQIQNILKLFSNALRKNGVFYMSFKYGENEEFRNGRIFSNYNEHSFKIFLSNIPKLKIFKMWKTYDVRPNREDELWLNILIVKN
ncbi:MAG: SAM-dependent methyltransferase [Chloroflexi bacterium HGW-Chloroflexi-2]|jgi:SAM-dependent methyltransferase|nr:MAG: SAM-dependent methyltransferase [Chloroflexi bacterium HGW-Chloroflexi-2]